GGSLWGSFGVSMGWFRGHWGSLALVGVYGVDSGSLGFYWGSFGVSMGRFRGNWGYLGSVGLCGWGGSHRWGRGLGLLEAVVGRDSAINVPNSVIGIVFYSLQALLGASPMCPLPVRVASSAALLVTSVTSVVASLYLALVLAFGLHDLCVVCLSTYAVNAALLFLNWRRWRRCGRSTGQKRD
uniref:vitamin-K-epoxide reductase (warfarin-sensitive) n=1 Tax=Phasianus colchicus TaxID=9054 RepID=A0A669Q755_PHACC